MHSHRQEREQSLSNIKQIVQTSRNVAESTVLWIKLYGTTGSDSINDENFSLKVNRIPHLRNSDDHIFMSKYCNVSCHMFWPTSKITTITICSIISASSVMRTIVFFSIFLSLLLKFSHTHLCLFYIFQFFLLFFSLSFCSLLFTLVLFHFSCKQFCFRFYYRLL